VRARAAGLLFLPLLPFSSPSQPTSQAQAHVVPAFIGSLTISFAFVQSTAATKKAPAKEEDEDESDKSRSEVNGEDDDEVCTYACVFSPPPLHKITCCRR
jgi:hypothetical protein